MKPLLHLGLACVVLGYLIVGYIAYLLFWPMTPFMLTAYSDTNPVQILNTVVHPGDALEYNLSYCKNTDLTATIHRTFVDGQVITLTDTKGELPQGCRTIMVNTATVPETVNPGKYYLDVTIEYDINPLRKEYVHYKTTSFTVIKK